MPSKPENGGQTVHSVRLFVLQQVVANLIAFPPRCLRPVAYARCLIIYNPSDIVVIAQSESFLLHFADIEMIANYLQIDKQLRFFEITARTRLAPLIEI
jgi:hypothetical protein